MKIARLLSCLSIVAAYAQSAFACPPPPLIETHDERYVFHEKPIMPIPNGAVLLFVSDIKRVERSYDPSIRYRANVSDDLKGIFPQKTIDIATMDDFCNILMDNEDMLDRGEENIRPSYLVGFPMRDSIFHHFKIFAIDYRRAEWRKPGEVEATNKEWEEYHEYFSPNTSFGGVYAILGLIAFVEVCLWFAMHQTEKSPKPKS
jgi:hypothetical protein